MTKKSKSKPMTQILERLCKFEYITVVIMGEDVILNEPVENWPSCDCLISFHSKGKKGSPWLLTDPPQPSHPLPAVRAGPLDVFQGSHWTRQLSMPNFATPF